MKRGEEEGKRKSIEEVRKKRRTEIDEHEGGKE